MSRLFQDIEKEPQQLLAALTHTLGAGRAALEATAKIVRRAAHVYIVGIGSSWHAGMAAHAMFNSHGRPALLYDASELLHFAEIPPNAAVIMLSRSGKSVEIVRLIDKFRGCNGKIIAVTNSPESPLAVHAEVVLHLKADFDHQVSVSMYSTLALVGALLACETGERLDDIRRDQLQSSLAQTESQISAWSSQINSSNWLEATAPTYFLARGASLSSCYEARLLWEEAAKAPAAALSTGSFRHGPQEIVRLGFRVGLWIDGEKMRSQDLALAADLRAYGASVLLIGQDLPAEAADLVLNIPPIPAAWQFMVDIIPIQLAAERLAQLRHEDCDAFRICPYIIEAEGGLTSSSVFSGGPQK